MFTRTCVGSHPPSRRRFRGPPSAKSLLETRPIFPHKVSDNLKGHVFASFLALYLMVTLRKKIQAVGGKRLTGREHRLGRPVSSAIDPARQNGTKVYVAPSIAREGWPHGRDAAVL